jgi:hypothetical protein
MGRVKPRGYPLRRWLRLDQRTNVRRRVLARSEQEPRDEVDEVAAGYDWEGVRLNYAQWGCIPPPPPSARRGD